MSKYPGETIILIFIYFFSSAVFSQNLDKEQESSNFLDNPQLEKTIDWKVQNGIYEYHLQQHASYQQQKESLEGSLLRELDNLKDLMHSEIKSSKNEVILETQYSTRSIIISFIILFLTLLATITPVIYFMSRYLVIRTMNSNDRDFKKQLDEVKEEADESILLTRSFASLSNSFAPSDREKFAEQIKVKLEKKPTDRTLAILAARLQRHSNDLLGAISTLDAYIDAKKAINKISDHDYSDALYNRACYKSLLCKVDPDKCAEAIEDLRQSIAICEKNAEDAMVDQDFDMIKEDDRFKALVGNNA